MKFRFTSRRVDLSTALLAPALVAGCSAGPSTTVIRPTDGPAAQLFDAAQDEQSVDAHSVLQDQINTALSTAYGDAVGHPLSIEKIAGASITSRYSAETAGGASAPTS